MKTLLITVLVLAIIGGGTYVLISYANDEQENANNAITAADVVSGTSGIKIKESTDQDLAVAKAQELYRAALINGEDLSDGPCLSNEVIDGWAVDIAHDPRQDVDNLPENQCAAYRSGEAKHFVELDTDGNLIRAE